MALGLVAYERWVQMKARDPEALMRPYIERLMDSHRSKLNGKSMQISRYWVKGITFERAYEMISKHPLTASWQQVGGMEWETDSRVVAFRAKDGRSYKLFEFVPSYGGFEFDVRKPVVGGGAEQSHDPAAFIQPLE
ncbi:MAG: hypothetical protein QOJ65_2797 [Fimbriimonadaceae bacterium]|jgi:hypothetical protein|nr:hypothetical protein [Fimbriimonadaceae bacterium]